MTDSFWDLDNMPDVPEPPKPQYADVPDKAWVLIKNATREQKEGAQPKILTLDGREGPWYKLKTGFIVVGGDTAIKPNHAGRYIFWECSTHKNPEKDPPNMPCHGQLYNLILDALAPVDEPVASRWQKARAILARKAAELAYTPETFQGDTQLLYASVFKEVLLDTAYTVIAQTYTPKPREGKSYQPSQTVGSICADLTANRTLHKVVPVNKEEDAF